MSSSLSSSRPRPESPWPAATPIPSSSFSSQPSRSRSLKRRRLQDIPLEARASTSLSARQEIADQSEVDNALFDCQFNSGNAVISCFPTADTVVAQHQWETFVWNSRRPELTQTNLVDIFLFRADSQKMVLQFPNQTNPSDQAGSIKAQVDDRWWGTDGPNWNGKNVSFPFYWVVIRSDKTLDSNAIAQPIFSAVQTTFADSVISSSIAAASSASAAAASSSSLSALSVASAASVSRTRTSPSSSSTGSGSVQSDLGGSGFPHWAIAVIVVLGFLAIAALGILAFLITRRIRRRQREEIESNRNSMGSASPMMAKAGHHSPLLAAAALPVHDQPGDSHSRAGHNAPSLVMHDGASTSSRAGSAGEAGPFSGADAAIMADAFRKMLRKPDFAGRPEGEESPDSHPERKEEILNRELAEEGRDMRSVSSSRGVKVETLSDAGGGQDNQHFRD